MQKLGKVRKGQSWFGPMKTAILPFLLLLATFLRITSSGSAEEGLDQVTQPISSSKNNNEIPEDSHDNRLQDNYGFVRRARMAKVDWIWEAVDGVRYEQGEGERGAKSKGLGGGLERSDSRCYN